MPRHLLMSILEKAHSTRQLGPGAYNNLQLVCKSWRDAVLELLAEVDYADVYIQHPSGLALACKMLPAVSSFLIVKEAEFHWLPLDPLSALSRLTTLCLANNPPILGRPIISLDQLPAQLRSLRLTSFEMEITSPESSKFSQLTDAITGGTAHRVTSSECSGAYRLCR